MIQPPRMGWKPLQIGLFVVIVVVVVFVSVFVCFVILFERRLLFITQQCAGQTRPRSAATDGEQQPCATFGPEQLGRKACQVGVASWWPPGTSCVRSIQKEASGNHGWRAGTLHGWYRVEDFACRDSEHGSRLRAAPGRHLHRWYHGRAAGGPRRPPFLRFRAEGARDDSGVPC